MKTRIFRFKKWTVVIVSAMLIAALAVPMVGVSTVRAADTYLRAFPDGDYVDGYGWPAGEPVMLTVEEQTYGPVTAAEDGSVGFWTTGHDLVAGDALVMSSGDLSVAYTVSPLMVTDIDMIDQTIAGTVDGPQQVHLWVGEFDGYQEADEFGNWNFSVAGYEPALLVPGACGNAEAWGSPDSASSTIIDWCVAETTWRDEFDGSLADGWYWVNEVPERWNLTENPGYLRLYTSTQGFGGENLLLRPVYQDNFTIETRLVFQPDTDYQIAGLVIYQDDGTHLTLGRAYCDNEWECAGDGIYFDYVQDGTGTGKNYATPYSNPSDPAVVYLRMEHRGQMVKGLYSYDGVTWFEAGIHWVPENFNPTAVGLWSGQDFFADKRGITADYDFFELSDGWNFLPYGYHDGEQGDVPSFACNVGGWATDPDDLVTDLMVEVKVDGTALPDWLIANAYREDLDTAGVCADGNCSFSASLWDSITPYEEHTIDVYAQDIPLGDWVRLTASPKTLTCRSYDIYLYDPETNTSSIITTAFPRADEYNPSLSPNGKKIAHDVLFTDGSFGIYITDVKSGESTALAGGENANDAVWSPNGKWIAFDRQWNGTNALFMVPAAGGEQILIRENALSADWAPNGKRIVFRDFFDNSVRTIGIDGGSAAETIVAPAGYDPVWSPDGNWIAYALDGDIWKVQVDIHGMPLGEPVQLTSGLAEDGQPTWSADGLTVAYHSGVEGDWDIWAVPAAGGEPTLFVGAPIFGDYDPSFAKDGLLLAYSSFSPNIKVPGE